MFLMCRKSFPDINEEYRCKHTQVTCRNLFAKDVLCKVQLHGRNERNIENHKQSVSST